MSHCGFWLFRVREALARMIGLEPTLLRLILETKLDRKAAIEARKEILKNLAERKRNV